MIVWAYGLLMEWKEAISQALGEIGRPAQKIVPVLIQALTDENYTVRQPAAGGLGRIGEAAQEAALALIEALTDGHYFVCSLAAWAWGEIGELCFDILTLTGGYCYYTILRAYSCFNFKLVSFRRLCKNEKMEK